MLRTVARKIATAAAALAIAVSPVLAPAAGSPSGPLDHEFTAVMETYASRCAPRTNPGVDEPVSRRCRPRVKAMFRKDRLLPTLYKTNKEGFWSDEGWRRTGLLSINDPEHEAGIRA